MTLSRRTFLKSSAQAFLAQSVPRPILGFAENILGPENSVVQSVAIPDLWSGFGGHFLTLGNWVNGFGGFFNHEKVFPEAPIEGLFHEAISNRLNSYFPALFREARITTACNSKLMTGNLERDNEIIHAISGVYEFKRKFCFEGLRHLINLSPPEYERQSEHERKFSQSAARLRIDFDSYKNASLGDLDDKLQRMTTSAQRAGLVTIEEADANGWRDCGSHNPQIKSLCELARLPVEGINSLIFFLSRSGHISDRTCGGLPHHLLDDRQLMAFMANKVGEQSSSFVQGLHERHADNLTRHTINYIANEFETTVQGLYQHHCGLAMPELSDVPLPKISKEILNLFRFAAFKAESSSLGAETVEAEGASSAAIVEATPIVETGTGLSGLSSALRIASTGVARIQASVQIPTEVIDQSLAEGAIDFPCVQSSVRSLATNIIPGNAATTGAFDSSNASPSFAPAIDLSPAMLMETAGIATPRLDRTAAETPAP